MGYAVALMIISSYKKIIEVKKKKVKKTNDMLLCFVWLKDVAVW